MEKKSIWGIVAGSLLILSGCSISTPEIRGVVLDEETKQPVPEAWIHANMAVQLKHFAGGSGELLSVDPPHTRTNEKGEFVVPPRKFALSAIPYYLGATVLYFCIAGETIDDRMGGFDFEDYKWKAKVDVIIYVKPWEKVFKDKDYLRSNYGQLYYLMWEKLEKGRLLEAYDAYLMSLYRYCLDGRFFIERPVVGGGGDEWEVNYAIAKYERFLKGLGEPRTRDQRVIYSGSMEHLGYLYKKKRDYAKALEVFRKVLEFNRRQNDDLSIKGNEAEIEWLKNLLGK